MVIPTWVHDGFAPFLLNSEPPDSSQLVLMNGTTAVKVCIVLRFDVAVINAESELNRLKHVLHFLLFSVRVATQVSR